MPELLLEILSEEIPARMQARAADDLRRLMAEGLKEAALVYETMQAFVTPRRLAIVVSGLPRKADDQNLERRGPKVGAPDQAVQGFLRSVGLTSTDQLEILDTNKGQVYFHKALIAGLPVDRAIVEAITHTFDKFAWPKSMRWGESDARWVRPIHNILAILDGHPVAYDFDLIRNEATVFNPNAKIRLEANNQTYGHRFMAPDAFTVTGFEDYKAKLRAAYVMLDAKERAETIKADAELRAQEAGYRLRDDPGLISEVAGLVEWPVVLMGGIDRAFMDLPPEVLAESMRAHQKYFALQTEEGALAPAFITVANTLTEDGGEAVVKGNERVLRARLADARFFWDTDRKEKLENRVGRLTEIVFHAKLGTMAEKVDRMESLAAELCAYIPGADRDRARAAAHLCKADLVSGMVGEFPELQGVMGRYYALNDGEHEDVALAIAEHYAPKGPSDDCPSAPTSVAVALADKIDSLVGFFAIGEKPTGSRDPFALRRAALGVIRLITENQIRIGLHDALFESFRTYISPYDELLDREEYKSSLSVNDIERSAFERMIKRPYSVLFSYDGLADRFLSTFEDSDLWSSDRGLEERVLERIRLAIQLFTNDPLFPDARLSELEQIRYPELISKWESGELKLMDVDANDRRSSYVAALNELRRIFSAHVADALMSFFADRLKVQMREKGVRHDLISAVFATPRPGGGTEDDLVRLLARVEALSQFLRTDDGANLLTAYKRAANIVAIEEKKDKTAYDGPVDEALLVEREEKTLNEVLALEEQALDAALAQEDFTGAMTALAELRAPVDAVFDSVTINCDDTSLRANRLRLLARIRAALNRVADFSHIEG